MGVPTRKELDAKKQEINILYGKVSEVESSLKEEKKINLRLKGDLAAKMHQLTLIEKKIVEEQERYRWTKDRDTNRIHVLSSEGDKRIEELDLLDSDMSIEMAEHDLLEEENERLHARLKKVAIEHYKASEAQKEEREARKQSSFEMRATMEQILRRTLKEVDREYMLKAKDKMDNEAEWARLENAKLKKEAVKRQENCAFLVRQQKESYEELVHVKVQKDVLKESALKQEESSQLAETALEEVKGMNRQLEWQIEELQADIALLKSQVDHKKHLQAELAALKNKLNRAEAERRKTQRNSVLSIRKSVDRGLHVAAQVSKREGARLTKGFENMSDAASEQGLADPVSGAKRTGDDDNAIDNDATAFSSLESCDGSSLTFLNNEAAALALEKEELARTEEGNAQAMWNSTKSDVHISTRLRMEIRKMRKKELRDKLRTEAKNHLQ